MSLILLTIGCMIRTINFDSFMAPIEGINNNKPKSKSVLFNSSEDVQGLVLILIQILCSCFAGVYNEYLLKKSGVDVNIFIQNVFMYVDSIVCNVLVLMLQGNLSSAFTLNSINSIWNLKVILIIINSAIVGIITSLFLKSLNSILKTFASALELAIVAIGSYIFLGLSIHLNTILAICVVSFAIYLYSKAPVSSPVVKHEPNHESKLELSSHQV